ncbi:MAG: type VI secretion system lipoprotein TssJ [Chromatiaceae bacterium]|nr:type VI secretion system lipoprotein TssJ [Chromatiaceae bacterium]
MSEFIRKRRIACRTGLSLVLVLTWLSALTSCGGKPPKIELPAPAPAPAPMLQVDVSAAANANSTSSSRGLPIVVRLYELKSAGAFSGADFFSLYDREAEVLGDDLIVREEMTLAPGQDRQISRPLSPEARYLGVVGAFREIDRAQWRKAVPLTGGGDTTIAVSVGSSAIRAESL